jgi:hypothetical protein
LQMIWSCIKWPQKFCHRTPKPDKQLQLSGYKGNSNKSVAFLYSKDKQPKKKISELTSFIIVTNNINYLGVTLTKQVKWQEIQVSEERNRSQKIERSPKLMDWQD